MPAGLKMEDSICDLRFTVPGHRVLPVSRIFTPILNPLENCTGTDFQHSACGSENQAFQIHFKGRTTGFL
jgi:hypothetical protein